MNGLKPETMHKFNRALKYINDGLTISQSCKIAGISLVWFYKIRKSIKPSV